jgi:hypothetical protein
MSDVSLTEWQVKLCLVKLDDKFLNGGNWLHSANNMIRQWLR